MKQISLEIALSKLSDSPKKMISLEQYTTPSSVAASILYRAYSEGNIVDKRVADFGTGNGIFAVGAALLGAEKVYAVEKDPSMIEVAIDNCNKAGVTVEFHERNIMDFDVPVDTVVMNPPFGSRDNRTDVPFIERAFALSKNFYILLNYKAGDFLRKFTDGKGEVVWEEKMVLTLPHSYSFHKKEVKNVEARIARVKVW